MSIRVNAESFLVYANECVKRKKKTKKKKSENRKVSHTSGLMPPGAVTHLAVLEKMCCRNRKPIFYFMTLL